VPFDRDRIRVGLEKACEKRPVSAQTIDELVSEVESDVYRNMEREVPTDYIGELVMQKLRKLDPVAYVRFASVYREFKDASDFVEEIEPLLGKSPIEQSAVSDQ
jgi:transcriptional repressor NrdR